MRRDSGRAHDAEAPGGTRGPQQFGERFDAVLAVLEVQEHAVEAEVTERLDEVWRSRVDPGAEHRGAVAEPLTQ